MSEMYTFPCGCSWPVVGPPPREGALPFLDVDDDHLPFCAATWRMLGEGRTKGVFQLESSLGRTWTKKLRPESGEHMGALGAILRPGCLRNVDDDGVSTTQHYCRRKNNEEETKGYHPAIDWILAPTYGCMIYQEQAMEIAKAVAGFSLMDADSLRKAIGKKLAEEMAKVKRMFMEGVEKAGVITTGQGEELFGWIEKSQRYSFNKCISHREYIRRPNGGRHGSATMLTVGEMYRIRHDLEYAKATGHAVLRRKWKRLGNYGKGLSRCEDGRIRPNTIVDIQPAGMRVVYRVTLETGASVRVTVNHKFPTDRGEMTVSQMLDVMTDSVWGRQEHIHVFTCGEYEPSDFAAIGRFSDVTASQRELVGAGKKVNGHAGQANYGYTNGSFTQFEKNRDLLPAGCGDCGETKGRLETHHKDGNRGDSSLGNLIRLCSSCHKKWEYAAGRTRRGEKGYPSVASRVVSITPDGEEETYDVTMEGPAHNFVTGQGIVTCNSHAVSYGLTGYDAAYMKAHSPVAFFTSWLRYAREKQDPLQEVYELVHDAKHMGVTILPPDLRTLEPHFFTDGVDVQFGLGDIRGMGEKQLEKMLPALQHAQDESRVPIKDWRWHDFLFFAAEHVGYAAVQAMIRGGALAWAGITREQMVAECERWFDMTKLERAWVREREKLGRGLVGHELFLPDLPRKPGPRAKKALATWEQKAAAREKLEHELKGQRPWMILAHALRGAARPRKEGGAASNADRVAALNDAARMLENPGSPWVDRPDQVARDEEEMLGVALTANRTDVFSPRDVNTSCSEFLAGKAGYMVFGVTVEDVREVVTKRGQNPGQKMAFVTVSDSSSTLSDVVCFPDVWREARSLFTKGNCVIMQGERDYRQGTLVVRRASQMEE